MAIDATLTSFLLLAVGGAVQWVGTLILKRIENRSGETLAKLTATESRDGRALVAEEQAFAYLREALERARLRESELELDLATAERAAREALLDAFNVKTLCQSTVLRHEIDVSALRSQLVAAQWREKALRVVVTQSFAVMTDQRQRLRELGETEIAPIPHLPAHLSITGGDDDAG